MIYTSLFVRFKWKLLILSICLFTSCQEPIQNEEELKAAIRQIDYLKTKGTSLEKRLKNVQDSISQQIYKHSLDEIQEELKVLEEKWPKDVLNNYNEDNYLGGGMKTFESFGIALIPIAILLIFSFWRPQDQSKKKEKKTWKLIETGVNKISLIVNGLPNNDNNEIQDEVLNGLQVQFTDIQKKIEYLKDEKERKFSIKDFDTDSLSERERTNIELNFQILNKQHDRLTDQVDRLRFRNHFFLAAFACILSIAAIFLFYMQASLKSDITSFPLSEGQESIVWQWTILRLFFGLAIFSLMVFNAQMYIKTSNQIQYYQSEIATFELYTIALNKKNDHDFSFNLDRNPIFDNSKSSVQLEAFKEASSVHEKLVETLVKQFTGKGD